MVLSSLGEIVYIQQTEAWKKQKLGVRKKLRGRVRGQVENAVNMSQSCMRGL